MSALAADTKREFADGYGVPSKQFVVVNGDTVYMGSLVGIVSAGTKAGYVEPWAPVSGRRDWFLGIAKSKVVGDGTLEVEVCTSGVELRKIAVTGASTQAHVGQEVYASTDNDLTLTPVPNSDAIGWITRFFDSTHFDVRLYTPEEYRAQRGI